VDYLARTRELPVNVLFLLPWFALYQLCLFATRSPVENAAGAWVESVVGSLGPRGLVTIGLLVVGLLFMIVLLRAQQAPRDRGVFGGMLAEGLVYGGALGLVSHAVASHLPLGRMVALQIDSLHGPVQQLGLALGAGVFEEVVFRGLLLGGLWMLLRLGMGADRLTAALVSILASAWVFSAWHHWGVTGEPWDDTVFRFRMAAGAVLGTIFVTRGLGIAALAHGFYDALVMLDP
jgi:membrane protease YdiL (CAAX protease family)